MQAILNPRLATRSLDARPGSIRIHDQDDPERGTVEQFVRGVFADRFGARIRRFAPRLIALHEEGEVVAAAGYRHAGDPLFLERYLDGPVDAVIGRSAVVQPLRERIVEVGHLAAVRPNASLRLFIALADHLRTEETDWVVCTATRELRRIFDRLGLPSLSLATATPEALGDAASEWGSYYDHAPMVIAGRLAGGLDALRRLPEVPR